MREDDELFNDDDLQDGDIIGYHCLSCGYVQGTKGFNNDCDKCCACCLEEIIE